MKITKRNAEAHAENHGCILDAEYAAPYGWTIALYAPEDQSFVASDANMDCSLPGNGAGRTEVDWSEVIAAIDKIVSQGYMEESGV
jgi:hypothetical protein